MGRIYYQNKEEADGLKQVNVAFLKKYGYFNSISQTGTITWSRNGEETGDINIQSCKNEQEHYIRFVYTQTNKSTGIVTDCDYKIPLTTTPCFFGGKRYWFKCPMYVDGIYCGRRVGTLYLGDKYFACRHCYDLTYSSRNFAGIFKSAGQVVSIPDLERMKSEVKRKFYAGNMTKRYKRYILKLRQHKLHRQIVIGGLMNNMKRR